MTGGVGEDTSMSIKCLIDAVSPPSGAMAFVVGGNCDVSSVYLGSN